MARLSRFRQRMVAQRRKTFWFSGLQVRATLGAASTAAIMTSLNAAALLLRPFTIVRTRGFLAVRSDQVAASENQNVHHGLIVVSDQAVAVGVTAVPTPATDNGSGWFVLDGIAQRFDFRSSTGASLDGERFYRFDSKAMRKVEEGQDVVHVTETDAISAGATVTIFVRHLIKLH